MDELIKQGQWWWPFLVPIATGVLALVGSWVGTKLGKATEHQQWLRNQKLEVYTNLLRQSHASIRSLDAHRQGLTPEKNQLDDIKDISNARLVIVGSREVRMYAGMHYEELRRAFNSVESDDFQATAIPLNVSESRLEEAIRDDLELIEKEALRHTLRFWFYEHLVYPWRDSFERHHFRTHGYAWADRKHHPPTQ